VNIFGHLIWCPKLNISRGNNSGIIQVDHKSNGKCPYKRKREQEGRVEEMVGKGGGGEGRRDEKRGNTE
jgi:hypothetical protein